MFSEKHAICMLSLFYMKWIKAACLLKGIFSRHCVNNSDLSRIFLSLGSVHQLHNWSSDISISFGKFHVRLIYRCKPQTSVSLGGAQTMHQFCEKFLLTGLFHVDDWMFHIVSGQETLISSLVYPQWPPAGINVFLALVIALICLGQLMLVRSW